MTTPKIYCYVGNRLTQMNFAAAKAFKSVVNEIGKEIVAVWNGNPNFFTVHPTGNGVPRTVSEFRKMFQAEIADANSASVVSGALGIPISRLVPGPVTLLGDSVTVNQSQIDKQQPNIRKFVQTIE